MARKKEMRHEEYMKTQELKEKRSKIINTVQHLGKEDADGLHKAEQSYGDSWKQRGGIGAFMMAARKWDRLEKQVTEHGYDIFAAMGADQREEGILDDIRDLRRYLFLIDAEMCNRASQDD
jgi:uncharacterized coiled-coil DUF342 family protein